MKAKDQKVFLQALDELEKEKGIDKEELLEAVETALLAAYKKNYGESENVEVTINRETGNVKVVSIKKIVDKVKNEEYEISLEDAKEIKKRSKLGGKIEVEINADNFRRNAIQNAKQIVIQKVREGEKVSIYNKLKEKEDSLVTCVVRKVDERGNVYIDINGLESIINEKELSPLDSFKQGDRVKIYIGEVSEGTKFTKVFVSRKSDYLIKKLFALEIPEIEEGIIEIKSISREAGSRAKIAIYSQDEDLDIKGACIGKNGIRIQNIIDELKGEKIDIILWDEDIRFFVKNALSPAEVLSVEIIEENGEEIAKVEVAEDQLSLAIGKKGQNSRLAAKLCNIKIDISAVS